MKEEIAKMQLKKDYRWEEDGEENFINQMKEGLEKWGTKLKVLQLKDNVIPTGLVPLEEIFDQNDIAKRPKLIPTEVGVEECNIGTMDKQKMIKLSKILCLEMKQMYLYF